MISIGIGAGDAFRYDKQMWSRLFTVSLALLVLSACEEKDAKKTVREFLGERGNTRTEEREAGVFEGVVALGATSVSITKGPKRQVKLVGPENYLKKLTLRTSKEDVGGVPVELLTLELPFGIKAPKIQVHIVTPDLRYARVDRDSDMKLDDFGREVLTLRADMAGKIEMSPSAYGRLDIEVSQAARVVGPEVLAESAHLRAYGVSSIYLGQVADPEEDSVRPAVIGYRVRGKISK